MTHSDMVFEINVKRSYGQYLKFHIKSWEAFDFATFQNVNGARMAQTSAPLSQNALTNDANGASAPFSRPDGANIAHRSFQEAFPAHDGETKKSIQEELDEARSALANRSSELARLDDILAPAWAEEREVKSEITATHDIRDGVVVLDIGRAAQRAPLFRRLTKISERWGKQKAERANVNSHVRSLERDIARLEKLIEAEKRKAAGRGKKSASA